MADIKKSETCVLIPAYNEERNIALVAGQVRDLGFHVVIVDDGSKDRTVENARKLGGVDVLTSSVNQGKGAVLRRGFDWFLNTKYPALVMMDADGQHDPQELDSFLAALNRQGMDFVVGNRMDQPTGMPLVRRVTNRFLSWIISSVAGQKIPDSQCGYRALKRAVLEKVSLKTTRFEIESEMLLEAARKGFAIGSVPIRSVYEGEKSQINPVRDTLRFFSFLFTYLAKRRS